MPLTKCSACGKEISADALTCPNCGHPIGKLADQKNGRMGCFVIILIGVGGGLWNIVTNDKTGADNHLVDASKPESIKNIIHESAASPTATFRDGTLSLTYSIDPWLLTTSTAKTQFFFKAKEFFPKAFGWPAVQDACVEGSATFHDIRGNESQEPAMWLCMSRASALEVKWDNVDSNNLPSIVDRGFVHPSFNR
jgi:hypothetical protein